MITQKIIKEYLDYKEGHLFWKKQPNYGICVGDKSGTVNKQGYVQIKIFNKRYYAHRLIFFMFNGYFPQEIDHIDGNKSNNCIENLRSVTREQNIQNTKLRKDNTSGIKGVCWDKRSNKWKVQIAVNKKNHFLGHFDSIDLAKKTVDQFRKKHHLEYARYE